VAGTRAGNDAPVAATPSVNEQIKLTFNTTEYGRMVEWLAWFTKTN